MTEDIVYIITAVLLIYFSTRYEGLRGLLLPVGVALGVIVFYGTRAIAGDLIAVLVGLIYWFTVFPKIVNKKGVKKK